MTCAQAKELNTPPAFRSTAEQPAAASCRRWSERKPQRPAGAFPFLFVYHRKGAAARTTTCGGLLVAGASYSSVGAFLIARVIDIHNYERLYQNATNAVRSSTMRERNKQLILQYRDACLLRQTCGKVRLIRSMRTLTQLGALLPKDFDTLQRQDVEQLLTALLAHQPPYRASTIATTKAVLKRFLTWANNPDDFGNKTTPPACVAWLTVHLRRRDQQCLQRNDLLLPSEVTAAIATTHNPRDRALLSMLWESGARIGEIGNLQRKHLTPATVGYHVDLTGKTGQRSILLVSSAPSITEWLNHHPNAAPDAPVWHHYQYRTTRDFIEYRTINKLVKNAFLRAGITKRVHPHIFRHSRATYVLATGLMNEAQAKAYFGWTPGSTILAHYAHLLASDANNAILRENHLTPLRPPEDTARPTSCATCGNLNPAGSTTCSRCATHLDLSNLLARLVSLLVQHGLGSEAAHLVKDAGMGHVVEHLATKPREPVKQDDTPV